MVWNWNLSHWKFWSPYAGTILLSLPDPCPSWLASGVIPTFTVKFNSPGYWNKIKLFFGFSLISLPRWSLTMIKMGAKTWIFSEFIYAWHPGTENNSYINMIWYGNVFRQFVGISVTYVCSNGKYVQIQNWSQARH